MSENTFDFDKYLTTFVIDEPFFARFSMLITKVVNRNIPTIGVCINKHGRFEMHYNPEWLSQFSKKIIYGLLKHEFYHIILKHVTGRAPKDKKDAVRWNLATDLSINSFLEGEVPECGIFPGKGDFEKFPKFKLSESYYAAIPEEIVEKYQNGGYGDGEAGFDVHDGWSSEDIPEHVKKYAETKLRSDLQKLSEQAMRNNQWGSVPADIQGKIISECRTFVDWETAIRYFSSTTIRGEKMTTQKRVNKRYPYIQPGTKTKRFARLLVASDESGSVSDDLRSRLTSCLNGLTKIVEIDYVPFDTEVQEEYLFHWRKDTSEYPVRKKSGGTCFQCVTDFVNQNKKYDGVIILTDLGAPFPGRCRIPRMWVTDEVNFSTQPDFAGNEKLVVIR